MSLQQINNTLINIKNGYNANLKTIKVKRSKLTLELILFLRNLGYINGYFFHEKNINIIILELKYKLNGFKLLTVILNIKRIKKNKYVSYKKLKRNFRYSYSFVILNNKGMMTGTLAISKKLGGLILFRIC